MAEMFYVKLDRDKLRIRLSDKYGEPLSEAALNERIQALGFNPYKGGWVCEDISLKALADDEIIAREEC